MWLFSKRHREALKAWEKYPHAEGESMPVLFHAGFSMGVAEAQREAERGRKEVLREAGSAVARCGYVHDVDRTAFPSQRAVDQWEALDAIRALEDGE